MPDETRSHDDPGHTFDYPDATPPAPTAPVAPPGYELLEVVGRGGMGVVYRARDIALDREVAVKLLLDRYAPDSLTAARFLDEARITGQLQHPGIPAVYQVGTLPGGRPFLAMKLIKGDTLDALLKANAPMDALAVFGAVSQAVGYAHAHGVIHRDLKPANVMVGAFGEVQVMDWGLAKVLASRERPRPESDPEATLGTGTQIRTQRDDETPFTQHGSVLGTPAYMPPEQAAGELDKIDARSDVFGLGGLLCVLLTGEPPFVGKDSEGVRVSAMRGKTEDAFARLDLCAADPGVVALCKRCLAFEPADRPATADEVATAVAGLRHAADDRARQAERDKDAAEVRAAEQVKRRRATLWAAGAVATVLLGGVAGTGVGLARADAARRDAVASERVAEAKRGEAEAARGAEAEQRAAAEAAKKQAEGKEAEARALVDFFEQKVFAAARPQGYGGGLGHDVSLRAAIVAALPTLATGFKDQPLVEARLQLSLGTTFLYLGDAKAAVMAWERARAIYADRLGPDDRATLNAAGELAYRYHEAGRTAEAMPLQEAILATRRRVLGADHPDTLRSMADVAWTHTAAGHPDAPRLGEEALAARQRVLGADHPDTLRTMADLAYCYATAGRHAEAVRLGEAILKTHQRLSGPDHPATVLSMTRLAIGYAAAGRPGDALKMNEEGLAAMRRAPILDDLEPVLVMGNLALGYSDTGRTAEALALREEALAIRRRVLGLDHPDTLASLTDLASNYDSLGRAADALKVREELLAAWRRLPTNHPGALASLGDLANRYAGVGRHADALKLRQELHAASAAKDGPDHLETLALLGAVAESHDALGRPDEALKVRQEELAGRRKAHPTHPRTLANLRSVAYTLHKLGRTAEAVPFLDECILWPADGPRDAAIVGSAIVTRFDHFRAAGDPAGCRATAVLVEGLSHLSAVMMYNAACVRATASALYAKAGQTGEAAADADKAMTWLTKAVVAGYEDRVHIDADTDLDALRGRADFQKLMASLLELAPPPREAK